MGNAKKIVITVITIIGIVLIFIFQRGIYSQPQTQNQAEQIAQVQIEEPRVVSTKPDSLDGAVILPTQIIEIAFNMPLENADQLKRSLDPKTNIEVKLSGDKKTAQIIPQPQFTLGGGYTLAILSDSKFEGKKLLGHDITYHFSVISYKGI